jgi:diguanylate cyclase (GGDEF)-like protein
MHRWLTLLVIAVISLGATGALAWYLYDGETHRIEAEFQRDIGQRASQLEKELVKHRATLRYWRRFYETSRTIDTEQFRVIARDVLNSYPSLQMIAWAPMVPKSQRAAYERQFRQINPQFSIFTLRPERNVSWSESDLQQVVQQDPRSMFVPSGDQPHYFPVSAVEPMERAASFIGLDASSINPVRVAAQLARSRDSGDVAALPVFPSPFSPRHEPITVLMMPVFSGEAGSITERRNAVRGIIAGIFSIEELVRQASLADQPSDIGLQLVDRTGDEGLQLLYKYGHDADGPMAYERPIMDVLGRKWSVIAAPSDGYIAGKRTVVPYLALAGGGIFTVVLLLYVNLMQHQNNVVRSLVDRRTSELKQANVELNGLNQKLEQLSRIDSLTEVANRRYFNETLHREWKRAIREARPIAILLIDVDYFKRYNDQYGHLRGDECLQQVARALAEVFNRPGDLVSRYGGEEFAVILPNAGGEAMRVAERCRAAIEELGIAHEQSLVSKVVTVSVGMSSVVPNGSISPDYLLDCADKGLYIAKEHGRNRVIYHTCHTRPARDYDNRDSSTG